MSRDAAVKPRSRNFGVDRSTGVIFTAACRRGLAGLAAAVVQVDQAVVVKRGVGFDALACAEFLEQVCTCGEVAGGHVFDERPWLVVADVGGDGDKTTNCTSDVTASGRRCASRNLEVGARSKRKQWGMATRRKIIFFRSGRGMPCPA